MCRKLDRLLLLIRCGLLAHGVIAFLQVGLPEPPLIAASRDWLRRQIP